MTIQAWLEVSDSTVNFVRNAMVRLDLRDPSKLHLRTAASPETAIA